MPTSTEKQEYASLGSLCKGSIVATNDLSAEIEKKAPLDSPELEGQPLAPDPTFESQPRQIANIGYVNRVVDETSPLVAKSFTVPKNGEDGSGAASTMYFRPRFFGMVNGDRMKSFIVRKRLQVTAAVEVQVQLKTESGTVVATTKPQTLPAESGAYVPFEFPASVALASKDALYKLVFCNASTGAELAANLNFFIYPSDNPDCYFGVRQTFVPELTMQFYSWASDLVVKPAAFTEGNLAAFDENGNLADSAKSPSDFLEKIDVLDYNTSSWDDFLELYNKQKMVYVKIPQPIAGGQAFRYGSLTYYFDSADGTDLSSAKAEFLYHRSLANNAPKDGYYEDQAIIYTLQKHDKNVLTNSWKWYNDQRAVVVRSLSGDTLNISDPDDQMKILSAAALLLGAKLSSN